MNQLNKFFLKKFFICFLSCFIILICIFSSFMYLKSTNAKKQANLIAGNINYRIEQALLHEGEKLIIFEEILLDKGDLILNAMNASEGRDYGQQFVLTARLLHKKNLNDTLQLIAYNNISYTYPAEDKTKITAEDTVFLDQIKEKKYDRQSESLHRIYAAYDTADPQNPKLILRNPVYFMDGTAWGFAKMQIYLNEFLHGINLDNLHEQGYVFYFTFENDGKSHTIFDPARNTRSTPAAISIPLYDKSITFHIVPKQGWIDLQTVFSRFGVVFVVSLLVAYYMSKFSQSVIVIEESRANGEKAKEITIQAYKNADQANTAKNSFLSTMSHDMRTPMNAIMGFCSLLEMDYADKEKVLNYSQKINSSCQHLLRLINDVLDMGKIESGKVNLQLQNVPLAKLLDEVNLFIRPLAEEKKQLFTIETRHINHENIIADKLRLNQILLNLLSNAVKYTPKGGCISLSVHEIPKNSNKLCELEFTVRDNGIGISKEFLSRIFEPFSRETGERLEAIQGTGLGMAITKNLVDLMGGTITVQSQIDKGTVFTVNLTFQVEETADESNFLKEHGISRIAVIDSDHAAQNVVKAAFAPYQVEVLCAETTDKALELLQSEKHPELILLGEKLNENNWLEFAKKIRNNNLSMPIFLLTENEWTNSEQKAFSAGIINGSITKPFFFSKLKAALESILCAATPAKRKQTLKNLNILVAEDNDINIQVIENILCKLGAACTVCKNGQIALETFERSAKNEYNAILMDIQMPVLNGLEAAAAIRACSHADAKSIPIIAMTANAFSEDVKASLASGMNAHLPKPVSLTVLSETILKFVHKTDTK